MTGRKAHPSKSAKVKKARGFSPEEVVEQGHFLRVLDNKNYPGQTIEEYWFLGYGWCVVVDKASQRLITAYQSRKVKR